MSSIWNKKRCLVNYLVNILKISLYYMIKVKKLLENIFFLQQNIYTFRQEEYKVIRRDDIFLQLINTLSYISHHYINASIYVN